MARAAHRLPRHIPAHRVPSKVPSAKAVGTGAVAAGCLAMTLVPVAANAKGHSNGHGGPAPVPTGPATCTVPTTALGDAIVIDGTGYAPGEMLQEWWGSTTFTAVDFIGADATGQLSGQLGWANQAGPYRVSVFDVRTGGLLATCSFSVS